ncbi:hypothetical protein Aperf_G00000087319 [Anoplocephala perfoliata]
MGLSPWVWIFLFFTVCELQPSSYGAFYKKLKVRINGDIMIGALFPIHEQPTVNTAFSRQCGNVREHYGIHRIEFLLKTIHEINQNEAILPGIKLGVDARDSCWYAPVALEQCMDFIQTASLYREYTYCLKLTNGSSEKCLPSEFSPTSIEIPISALIGPGTSEMSKQVQQVLQIFSIPQIGYSATAADLSNKADYQYFLRVAPSDALQIEYNTEAFVRFYGDSGISALKARMNTLGICSEIERKIDNKETAEAFLLLAEDIFSPSRKAKVIICFCQGETVEGLLQAMNTLKLHDMGYTLIGTDGWSDRLDVLGPPINTATNEYAYSRIARGSFTIKLHSPKIKDFDDYFTSLTPQNHRNINPWFTEFWEQKFNCQINYNADSKQRKCTGLENLKDPQYQQDNKLSLLNLAIYVVALGLHRVQEIICGVGYRGVCPGLLPVNGTLLRQELLKVKYTDQNNDTIYFDENGDPPASYDLMNYQYVLGDDGRGTFQYVQVGRWSDGHFTMFQPDHVQWHNEGENASEPMQSFCSEPCKPWEAKIIRDKLKSCCWLCQPCRLNEWKTPNGTCETCKQGFRPNENKTECEEIIPTFIHWTDPACLTAAILASLGGIFTILILIVFVVYRDTPVVKASTRELMWIILLAMLLAHVSVATIPLKPSAITCGLQRSFPAIAFTIIYAALVTKTNRIARILEGSKRILLKKQRFLSTTSQLVITALLIAVEIITVTTMLMLEPPQDELLYSRFKTRARIHCNTSKVGTIIPLAFPIFLIAMCTIYAIKTRNLPQNFNEAKFIGFTMYTTCVLWLAVLPVYFSGYETEVILVLCISVSASIALVILFLPKTYIILCRPDKNSRAAFITAKDIRCHIGVLQTNVDPKVRKSDKWWKKGAYMGESSAFTEVIDMGNERKITPSPQLEATPGPVNRGLESVTSKKTTPKSDTENEDAASHGSADSVQVAVEGNKQRKSFIRREKRIYHPETKRPRHFEAICQTDWSVPPGRDLELAEMEDLSTDSETRVRLSNSSLE